MSFQNLLCTLYLFRLNLDSAFFNSFSNESSSSSGNLDLWHSGDASVSNERDVETGTLDEISESPDFVFDRKNSDYSDDCEIDDEDNDFTPAKLQLPTLEQIAEDDNEDIVFELDEWNDDENDSLNDSLTGPQHGKSFSELLRPDIENPDPSEIIDGTAGLEEEDGPTHRPKLWATAMAVTALVGLGAVKVLQNSSDLDDVPDFNNSFSSTDGGGGSAAKASAEGGAAKAGGEGGAAKAGADAGGAAKAGGEGGAAKAGGEYGVAKASGDGTVAKGGDTVTSGATKGSSDGIGGGGGETAGNHSGGGAGGNDTGAGGARPRTQQ